MNMSLDGKRLEETILRADRIITEAFKHMPRDARPSDQMKYDLREFCEVVAIIKMVRGE